MLSYCLKCRKKTESKNPKVVKTKNRRRTLLSKYGVCNGKKSKFLKEQEAKHLLGRVGIRTTLSQVHILGLLFFWNIKWIK